MSTKLLAFSHAKGFGQGYSNRQHFCNTRLAGWGGDCDVAQGRKSPVLLVQTSGRDV